ncbi:nicotinate-nucleotide adenylyltransferase [Candidatus Nitrospira bockiana]
MRIGLFGGTFNPIHRCHLEAAGETRNRLRLDRVLFIPTGDPPHKPTASLVPASHRLQMVKLAIAGQPAFGVSEVEIRRPSKSYSIDTIHELQKELGPDAELFFIIGLDAFLDLPTWKQAPDLLRACHFVVLSRPGAQFASLLKMSLLPAIDRAPLIALDTQRALQVDVSLPSGTRLILLWIPPCPVSASEIRSHLARGRAISNLLPAPVESYIMQHNLYR